jgi:hypothetical protein
MNPFDSNASETITTWSIRAARREMAQGHRRAWACVSLVCVRSFAKGDT